MVGPGDRTPLSPCAQVPSAGNLQDVLDPRRARTRSPQHLPRWLDSLVGVELPEALFETQGLAGRFYDRLLARAVQAYGDSVTDERLFAWLALGATNTATSSRDRH